MKAFMRKKIASVSNNDATLKLMKGHFSAIFTRLMFETKTTTTKNVATRSNKHIKRKTKSITYPIYII